MRKLSHPCSEENAFHSFISQQITIMFQKYLIYISVLFYLIMAFYFFREWLEFFLADEQMTSQQRLFSGIIMVIASMFWILVVPFAYLELLKFHKKNKHIIDLLIDASDKGISDTSR